MTAFILELATHVAKDLSINGLKFAAKLGYDRLSDRVRRKKAADRFGLELALWQEYLNEERARLERSQRGSLETPVLCAPPPRILFTDADSVLALARDLDDDGRAALTLAHFCMAEMNALVSDTQLERSEEQIRLRLLDWSARVEKLSRYFDRALGLLLPADFAKAA